MGFYEDGDIYFLTKGSNTFQFLKKGFKDSVNAILRDDNSIWIAYQSSGLICLNIKDGALIHHFNSDTTKNLKLPSDRVRNLIKDDNNQVWVVTNFGIAIIGNYKVKLIINKQKHSELPHQSIYSLYKNSNKNIWFNKYNGLNLRKKVSHSLQGYFIKIIFPIVFLQTIFIVYMKIKMVFYGWVQTGKD